MIRIFFLSLAVLSFVTTAHAKVFNAQTATLKNGLQVVVVPNHRAPLVHHMLWYKVGSAQETAGYSGAAHFLEHLLFKGTDKIAEGEFSKRVRALGGEDNAFTSKDYTAYYQTISKDHLGMVMAMEANRMRNIKPTEAAVKTERNVVLEERSQRTDNNPKAQFYEQLQSALYPNHPYGVPTIGWMNEVSGLQWENAKEFYNKWYYPNNAVLVISGDVTLAEVLPLAKKTYGKIRPLEEVPERNFPTLPEFNGETRIIFKSEQVKEPLFTKGTRVPSYTKDSKTALALQIIVEALSGGPTTPFYKELVVNQKKAINISLSYDAEALDVAAIWIGATPANGVSLEKLEETIGNFIADILKTGIDEEQIRDSKKRLKRAAVFARDSLATPANIIGQSLATGTTLEEVENWPERIESVGTEDLDKALQIAFGENSEKRSVTGYFLPEGSDE